MRLQRTKHSPKGYPFLRGFSQTNHLFPKHSPQTWPVSRIHPCELPKLHIHKFISYPKLRNIFFGNKLTMLFVGILNLRTNSFQPGGHDTNQSNQQMTKDTSTTSQKGQSSQYTKSGPTKPRERIIKRRESYKLEYQKFFLLFFSTREKLCK